MQESGISNFVSMKAPLIVLFFLIATVTADSLMRPGKDHPATKAALGKMLFNEKILSLDSSVSCASCHKPEYAFADTVAFSKGIHNKPTARNTPSVLNMKDRPYYFWDGRASSLEAQSLMPIANPDEMGLAIKDAVYRLNNNKRYRELFYGVFKQAPSRENLSSALAAYEQTLERVNSKFDEVSNGKGRLTAAEERGRKLFIGRKAKCFDCHTGPDFTGDGFKSIGLLNEVYFKDSGRYSLTKKRSDLGRFKVPGLRNVAVTAPYMHNGYLQPSNKYWLITTTLLRFLRIR